MWAGRHVGLVVQDVVDSRLAARFWELMPGYVKARLCPWDLAALGIILVPLLLLRTRRPALT